MEISFEVMLELVNGYCNQKYTPENVPSVLVRIINMMMEYQKNGPYNGTKSETSGGYSVIYDEKDMFSKFAGLLSPYKRLKTL